jgi:hypothetical protein
MPDRDRARLTPVTLGSRTPAGAWPIARGSRARLTRGRRRAADLFVRLAGDGERALQATVADAVTGWFEVARAQ